MEALSGIYNFVIHPFILIYINLLILCLYVLSLVHIPYALGFSIILSTIIIKLITYPLNSKQLRASYKMQSIAPHLAELKVKHKGDNKRIQEETMRLYREHGVNPAAGCLPIFIQFPIFIALYNVLTHVVKGGAEEQLKYINSMVADPLKLQRAIDLSFFGIPLGRTPTELWNQVGPVIALVPIATVILTFLQSKMLMPKPVKIYPSDSNKEKSEKKENKDLSSAMQSQMTYVMPFFVGLISISFPMGLSLYWNTFTVFGIIQQYKIQGLGGLEEIWQKIRPQSKK